MEEVKESVKDLGGRPPMFETPQELEAKVEAYFLQFLQFLQFQSGDTPKEDLPKKAPLYYESRPTITGLCLYLGFESRQSFYAYEQKEVFSYTIKKARTRIENQYEQMLTGGNPTGSIFALKNLGWTDKQEVISRNVNYNTELTQEDIKKISQSLDGDV